MELLDQFDADSFERFLNLNDHSQASMEKVDSRQQAVDNLLAGSPALPTSPLIEKLPLLNSGGDLPTVNSVDLMDTLGPADDNATNNSITWLTSSLPTNNNSNSINFNEAMKILSSDTSNIGDVFDFENVSLTPVDIANEAPLPSPVSPTASLSSDSDVPSPKSEKVTRTFVVDIDDDELIEMATRDLNRRLQGYPKEVVRKIKAKRRTLKNRGYAQNCRTKRLAQKDELESDNMSLVQQLNELRRQLDRATNERDLYKRENDRLRRRLSAAETTRHH